MNAALLKAIADVLEKNSNATVIIAPASSWDVLGETLDMDSESGAFDRALRREIRQALDNLVVLATEEK
jgi:hypothetical protein